MPPRFRMPSSRTSSRLLSRASATAAPGPRDFTRALSAETDIEDAPRPLGKIGRQALANDGERQRGSRLGRARAPASSGTRTEVGACAEDEESTGPPPDWQEMYSAVQQMRSPGGVAHPAPVDMMGCERLADTQASPLDQRFQTLVALMLSSQTQDGLVARAMRRLKTELPGHQPGAPAGLNLDNMLAVQPELLKELIGCVGFPAKKTKYLKTTAESLRQHWRGDIPDSIEGLVSLSGVGYKMAHLTMSAAWGRTLGIGVDTHVARITGRIWGWHDKKKPEDVRKALESWLPRDKWREINWLLVGFGQTVCLPLGSRCGDCELGLRALCKAAVADKVRVGRQRKLRQQQQEQEQEQERLRQQRQQEEPEEGGEEDARSHWPQRQGREAQGELVEDMHDARGGQADTWTAAAASGRMPGAMRCLRSASKR